MGRAVIEIDPQSLLELFKPGERHYLVHSDIPPDARLVGAEYSATRDIWLLGFESDSLPETSPAVPLPRIDSPLLTVLYPEEVTDGQLQPVST